MEFKWIDDNKLFNENELFLGELIQADSHCDVDYYFDFLKSDGDLIEFDKAFVLESKGIDHTNNVKSVIEMMFLTNQFDISLYDHLF